jgi:glycosyltransferase involved in cell wall biosynthesis
MKVSVCMVTYNQERFIAQAIESVVTQETDFDYEVLIGEDCSTDRTREICIAYREKYPQKIRLLLHEQNLGMIGKPNFIKTLDACQGEYIAVLEGDDYWIPPQKLQKQADFLDRHRDYAVCFTGAMITFEDKRSEPAYSPPPEYRKPILTIEDLLRLNAIHTCTVMYRRRLFTGFPDWYYSLNTPDHALNIIHAQQGEVGYIDQATAIYNFHGSGVWSSRDPVDNLLGNVHFYKTINAHLNYKYKSLIQELLARTYQDISANYFARRDMSKARRYALQALKSFPVPALFSRRVLTVCSRAFKSMAYLVLPGQLVRGLARVRRTLPMRE